MSEVTRFEIVDREGWRRGMTPRVSQRSTTQWDAADTGSRTVTTDMLLTRAIDKVHPFGDVEVVDSEYQIRLLRVDDVWLGRGAPQELDPDHALVCGKRGWHCTGPLGTSAAHAEPTRAARAYLALAKERPAQIARIADVDYVVRIKRAIEVREEHAGEDMDASRDGVRDAIASALRINAEAVVVDWVEAGIRPGGAQ